MNGSRTRTLPKDRSLRPQGTPKWQRLLPQGDPSSKTHRTTLRRRMFVQQRGLRDHYRGQQGTAMTRPVRIPQRKPDSRATINADDQGAPDDHLFPRNAPPTLPTTSDPSTTRGQQSQDSQPPGSSAITVLHRNGHCDVRRGRQKSSRRINDRKATAGPGAPHDPHGFPHIMYEPSEASFHWSGPGRFSRRRRGPRALRESVTIPISGPPREEREGVQ